jgi:hypothetical protein
MADIQNLTIPAARARMMNMLTGADLQALEQPPPQPPSFLDALRYPGTQAAAYLRNGLSQMQEGVQDTIQHSPRLAKIKQFLSDFGSGLSTGVANAPLAIQSYRQSQQQLPDVLRQAGGR